jgi:hypothetical protein
MFEWAGLHGIPVAFVFAGGYEGYGLTLDQVVDLHRLTIEAARDAQAALDAQRYSPVGSGA